MRDGTYIEAVGSCCFIVVITDIVVRTTVNRRNQVEIEIKNNYFCILEVEHPESSSSSSGLWKRNFEI